MLKVYGMPKTRSTRVVWALEELGAEYRYHKVDLLKGEGRSAEFLALNQAGKVPVLVDGELVLSESAAICTYLGDKFPESELVPQVASPERARYQQWCFFVLAELEQPLWTIAKHKFALPEEKRVPAVIDTAIWEFGRAAALLSKGLQQREHLVGNRFTMADLLAAHTLAWAKAFQVPHATENLDAYAERMLQRAALRKAFEVEQAGER